MPMSFPDFESLKRRAAQRQFRAPLEDETEDQFREAFANFMFDVDRVESSEIRTGRGWNNQHPLELLNNSVKGGLAALASTLRSRHYEEGEGCDGFSMDYKIEIADQLFDYGFSLQELMDKQHDAPKDKANFAELFKKAKSLKELTDKLYLDLQVVEVLINNGLNEDKPDTEVVSNGE